jgi:hypothetical protein
MRYGRPRKLITWLAAVVDWKIPEQKYQNQPQYSPESFDQDRAEHQLALFRVELIIILEVVQNKTEQSLTHCSKS